MDTLYLQILLTLLLPFLAIFFVFILVAIFSAISVYKDGKARGLSQDEYILRTILDIFSIGFVTQLIYFKQVVKPYNETNEIKKRMPIIITISMILRLLAILFVLIMVTIILINSPLNGMNLMLNILLISVTPISFIQAIVQLFCILDTLKYCVKYKYDALPFCIIMIFFTGPCVIFYSIYILIKNRKKSTEDIDSDKYIVPRSYSIYLLIAIVNFVIAFVYSSSMFISNIG